MATRQVSIYEDKETGDINELRDNKLAKLGISDPNANVGATDYVELMTSTGEPIKVTQQSLAAALGSIFAASDPKTFTKLLGMNSGSPMGIGPSDLASVLGGGYIVPSGTTFASFKNSGMYYFAHVATDCPAGSWGMLAVITYQAVYMVKQIFFPDFCDSIYSRTLTHSQVWTEWRTI